jgi:hypothetical protein
MARPPWSIEHDVREDADSIFVPADLLPDARPGDAVEIAAASSTRPRPRPRHGVVADLVDDEARGEFVTVKLEPPE